MKNLDRSRYYDADGVNNLENVSYSYDGMGRMLSETNGVAKPSKVSQQKAKDKSKDEEK